MKFQVMSDQEGRILAMAAMVSAQEQEKDQKGEAPSATFMIPQDGQHVHMMEINVDVLELEFPEIREKFRVSLIGEAELIPIHTEFKPKGK